MNLSLDAQEIRQLIIKKSHECGEASHLGGSLSMVDILTTLFARVLKFNTENLQDPERDIFILSKGHCVLGYYATMNHFGLMKSKVFDTFQRNGSHLIAHPVKNLQLGIESSNGSLGQGLSFGLGLALGLRLDETPDRYVFVMMGDGECNEGSVWETAASASEYNVDNLIVMVDLNGLRNDGINSTHINSVDLTNVWASFGWNVIEVDGHNYEELYEAFAKAKSCKNKPSVLLARTIKGCGISFMENNNDWHHNRVTTKTYDKIIDEWRS